MNLESALRLMAAIMSTLSLLLANLFSPYWFLLTGFVGFNLAQSAITGICPVAPLFSRAGCALEPKGSALSVARFTRIAAGTAIMIAVVAGHFTGSLMLVNVVVGLIALNLAQSAFSQWCPMMTVARRLGFKDVSCSR